MITIPVDGLTDITTYLTTLVTDLWPIMALVIGVPFGFYVINKVIGLVRSRTK